MSVDKFGQVLSSTGGVARGPPGEGFKLTPDGQYDMSFKSLTKVGNPVLAQDAVNLITLEGHVALCLKLDNDGKFNGKGKIINNIADPKESCDAVNLKTMGESCLLYGDTQINAKGRRVTNVKDPASTRDAANKQYVDNATPTKSGNYWGFGKRRLVDVGDPLDESDVVTKKFCTDLETRLKKEISECTSTLGQWVISKDEAINNLKNEDENIKVLLKAHRKESERQLRKFGQFLFTYIESAKGRSATEEVTQDNYINWEAVFNPSV